MLVILTGQIQTGKTRWLQHFVEDARGKGHVVKGVLSPGIWVPDGDGGFDKIGISSHLLPDDVEMPFASKRELDDEAHGKSMQADAAKLGWRIYDDSIQRVNDHFDALESDGFDSGDIIVVDEFGSLELIRNAGFTSALRILDNPAVAAKEPKVIIIVRPDLIPLAIERFEPVWKDVHVLDLNVETDRAALEELASRL